MLSPLYYVLEELNMAYMNQLIDHVMNLLFLTHHFDVRHEWEESPFFIVQLYGHSSNALLSHQMRCSPINALSFFDHIRQ